jgi:hypothetical protein
MAGSTTNTFFYIFKTLADVLNGKLEDQQLELLTQEDLDMDYRRWKNSRYGSRQNQYQVKITQQILHLNLVGITGYVGANRAAQVAAGSSKAGGVNVAF